MSWDFLNYEEGLIKNLHYGLIHSSKFSIFFSSKAPFINNDYIPKKYTLYKTNDLILADTSEDKKDVGKPLELKLDEYPIVCGLHTMHFREKKNVTIPFFKSYYFSSNMYHRFTYKYSEGVKVFSLKPSLFKYFVFSYPCKNEQEKIVNFLELIDKKINLVEAKISILKKYKKGIKKIVVKDSVRFWQKEYSNAIKLMEFLTEIKEFNENDGTYTHVTLSKEGISAKTDRYDRDFLVKSDDKKYRITRPGQLCYNPANLKFGVICLNSYSVGIFSPIYVTFQINNIIPEYLELIVTSNDFINYTMKFQQGTVYERMSVSVEDFLKIKIIPLDIKDQQKYAKISYSIDKKISKFENELLILQKFKNNLLSKLFI